MENNKSINLNELPPCLKTEHIASYLGISRIKAYNLVNSDGFPRIVLGKRIIIPKEKFLQWFEENIITSNSVELKAGEENA